MSGQFKTFEIFKTIVGMVVTKNLPVFANSVNNDSANNLVK